MPLQRRQYRVVLADDVRLALEMDKTFFQRSGFEVHTASDGLSALALTASVLPDIVVLDEMMPGLKGTEVCARLRHRPETAKIPVIVTSAFDTEALRESCRKAGVSSFVPKAAGREALLRGVAQSLGIAQRKSLRIPVFFMVEGVTGAKETIGKAVDLSEDGMCLESNRRYDVGATLLVRFVLPGERREIQAAARVSRAVQRADENYALGLEFDRINEGAQKLLNSYIDKSLSGR